MGVNQPFKLRRKVMAALKSDTSLPYRCAVVGRSPSRGIKWSA